MALENYIINASNTGAAGYHNAMAGMDQRKREAEVDRHNAYIRQKEEAEYRDKKMREAFEMAALMDVDETNNGPALDYLDRVSDELGVQRPERSQIGPALRTYRTQIGGNLPAEAQTFEYFSQAGGFSPEQRAQAARIAAGLDPRAGERVIPLPGGGVGIYRSGEMMPVVTPQEAIAGEGQKAATVEQAKQDAQIGAIPERSAAETAAAVEKSKAERQTAAAADLPKLADKANYAISVIDGLLNHPGLNKIVGAASLLPIVPGTEQAGADAYMKQIEGQAFLEAFEALKGGGQITQIEGEKATQAILRLSRKQSMEDFKASMNELKDIVTKAKQRAEKSAGVSRETLSVGTVEDGYVYVGGDPADEKSWVKQR